MSFFSKIYTSWKPLQKRKYKKILAIVKPKGLTLEIGASAMLNCIHIDIDPDELKKAKGVKILADGNFLPFKKNTFDTIVCIDTLHLLQKNFIYALKKNGLLILSIFYNKEKFSNRKSLLEKFSKGAKGQLYEIPGKENELVFVGRKL
jgi:hypothetical protein